MNPISDVTHSIVSRRLKYVGVLVKAGRIGEAMKEIAEVKLIDPPNPYAQAPLNDY